MSKMNELYELIRLQHYPEDSQRGGPKDNWKVLFGGIDIGDLHDCDGIGGHIGEFTETDMFDYVCNMAKEDLARRRSAAIIHEAVSRAPDFSTHGPNGEQSDFWFEEMLMYCHSEGKMIPLRYDTEGDLIDFFDFDQGFWIDLGETVMDAYVNGNWDKSRKCKLCGR